MWLHINGLASYRKPLSLIFASLLYSNTAFATSFDDAFRLAIDNDPWLTSNKQKEQSVRAQGEAAKYLPDPVFSVGLLNLPTDGFALDQEPMTQLRVGVSQQLARGDSLRIKKQQLTHQANMNPYQRADHKAKLRVNLALPWLDILASIETIALIESERVFIEKMIDIVEANYTSARDRTRQQDILATQVELSRLEDKLLEYESRKDVAMSRLSEWLPYNTLLNAFSSPCLSEVGIRTDDLPHLIETSIKQRDWQRLAELLANHPALLVMDESIKADDLATQLARQKYKPQWGVNAAYAVRSDDQLGRSRADFFTIGVTLDLSLNGYQRQDSELQASTLKLESNKTDKRVAIQTILSRIDSLYRKSERYEQRILGFENDILPKLQEQTDASLNAYTHDDGDFADAIRARIDYLNAQVGLIDIRSKFAKSRVQLNYFLTGYTPAVKQGGA